jgi:hypothetical protein
LNDARVSSKIGLDEEVNIQINLSRARSGKVKIRSRKEKMGREEGWCLVWEKNDLEKVGDGGRN